MEFPEKVCVISIMLYPLKTVVTESSCRTVEPRIVAPGPMDLVEDLGRFGNLGRKTMEVSSPTMGSMKKNKFESVKLPGI